MDEPTYKGVGVIVIRNNMVLVGTRVDNGKICGPGGHINKGESPKDAAMRETKEEFRIVPKNLKELGTVGSGKNMSKIYLCTEFSGEIGADNIEMIYPRFRTIKQLLHNELFTPFEKSLKLLPKSSNIAVDIDAEKQDMRRKIVNKRANQWLKTNRPIKDISRANGK
jgi:8-oxo-dGTP pyrophosphatase MutT (NUDIX family)